MVENMNSTPVSDRFTIGIFGKRNAGKSSLINALTGQDVAVTSKVPGTTTDPVYKAMELLPIGPVVFIDTAGLDDSGTLGARRVQKTYEVLHKCDFVVIVRDARENGGLDSDFLNALKQIRVPFICVLNKIDLLPQGEKSSVSHSKCVCVPASAETGYGIDMVKAAIIKNSKFDGSEPKLVEGLVKPGDTAVLVTPIDKSAPKGRLILPQQQTIRGIIENDAVAVVTKEQELRLTLNKLNSPPAIVITDSQAFLKVSADTPRSVPMTSFSILFARAKGNLVEMTKGVKRIENLKDGDKILIAEGCTHHRQADDIGKVKIPRWIREASGADIKFDLVSGPHFPPNLADYSLIVHCGGCMLNRREMMFRIREAQRAGVPITNYGMLIAYVQGILERALKPFPAASLTFSGQ